jgi:hypothetical protein
MSPRDWSLEEVELIVDDYFAMLEAELSGQPYSKVEHNRRLQSAIRRSKGSIEFKHQNISAVLVNFRQPFIAGYLPRQNYQSLLERAVLGWLAGHPRFFEAAADGPVLAPKTLPRVPSHARPSQLIEAPPSVVATVSDDESSEPTRFFRIDFVRRDAENRKLGRLGEEFVVEFERMRLREEARRPDLAKRVDWIAATRGDGAGYDVESFNDDGTPRLIEVKTTGLGKHFPFFVTSNEVRCSERKAGAFQLYRVFDFAREPHLYALPGALTASCDLEPTQYRARVKSAPSLG